MVVMFSPVLAEAMLVRSNGGSGWYVPRCGLNFEAATIAKCEAFKEEIFERNLVHIRWLVSFVMVYRRGAGLGESMVTFACRCHGDLLRLLLRRDTIPKPIV